MKYDIEGFILDTRQRTLAHNNDVSKIRPRTLSLLVYFIENTDRIISKEEILASVWPDVTVEEAVVFQSISEIRKLFNDKKVIVNHPRKGYQFVASITETATSDPKNKRHIKTFVGFTAIISLLLLVYLGLYESQEHPVPVSAAPKIIVMPVIENTSFENHKWLRLGGMDHVISTLTENSDDLFIYEFEDVIQILQLVNNQVEQDSDQMEKVFEYSEASDIVQIEIVGKALEYKLAMTFTNKASSQKKVLFAETLDDGLNQAANAIFGYFDKPALQNQNSLNEDFLHTLFAEAMLAYEKEWDLAISFLESYLSMEKDSVKAMLYLTKLYIWNDRFVDANEILERLSEQAELSFEDYANYLYYRGLLAHKEGNHELALEWFQEASDAFNTERPSILTARLHYSRGEVFSVLEQYESAIEYFQKALDFHQFTGNEVGINSAKLQLAVALAKSGNSEQGKILFYEASNQIKALNIEFLATMITDNQQYFSD